MVDSCHVPRGPPWLRLTLLSLDNFLKDPYDDAVVLCVTNTFSRCPILFPFPCGKRQSTALVDMTQNNLHTVSLCTMTRIPKSIRRPYSTDTPITSMLYIGTTRGTTGPFTTPEYENFFEPTVLLSA